MPGMPNLADILQLIIDGLDQGALAQEQLVPQAHMAHHAPATARPSRAPMQTDGLHRSTTAPATDTLPDKGPPQGSIACKYLKESVPRDGIEPPTRGFSVLGV